MRSSLPLLLLLCTLPAASQALPDAPSAAASTDQANPLPLVNGRHYRSQTEGERLHSFGAGLISPAAIGGTVISAIYRQYKERPDLIYWDNDAAGFGKRFGAAYGQRVINQGTRYTFGALLHEDNRYLICHGCTLRQKIWNAALADFSARHGADGHRTASPTGILSGFSGSLVAYAFWYPNQDPRFTIQRGTTNALTGFATRPASHFAAEILDGHKIPFLHRRFGDGSPREQLQVPVGFTGPLPPKHRLNPADPDTPTAYAPAAPPKGEGVSPKQ
ncbi:hypothetical protein [Terriglobus aquaticus]|uniref:Lipoprotein n=1 Tax=Terriglobus aquaticus TaxID=940139 RepID=A0ABW9KGX5_9BACT|nr:hypothetical protein [Terriglobus aquaticus]